MKKIILFFMIVCVFVQFQVSAEELHNEFYTYKIEDETITITALNDVNLNNSVIVPSYIDGKKVTNISSFVFNGTKAEEVFFANGIDRISAYAISNCANLKKIVIPPSCKEIGGELVIPAIEYCDKLETIEIYGEYENLSLFVADCPNLKRIIFYGDVKNTTGYFKYNFYKCKERVKRVNPREFTEPLDITIQGKAGTNIEKFAKENGFNFEYAGEKSYIINGDGLLVGSIASNWAKTELEKAEKLCLIPERLQGMDLTQPITREEFAEVSVKVYESLSGTSALIAENNPFTDTQNEEVLKAYNVGITKGTSDTTFEPSALLNREQAATMLTRVFTIITGEEIVVGGPPSAKTPLYYIVKAPADQPEGTKSYTGVEYFADHSNISDWARHSVYFMVVNEVIQGVGNNMFAPKNVTTEEQATGYANATREQALIIAVRMVENLKR